MRTGQSSKPQVMIRRRIMRMCLPPHGQGHSSHPPGHTMSQPHHQQGQSPCPPGYMLAPPPYEQGQSPCPPGYMLAPAQGQHGQSPCPPGYMLAPSHGKGQSPCPPGYMLAPAHGQEHHGGPAPGLTQRKRRSEPEEPSFWTWHNVMHPIKYVEDKAKRKAKKAAKKIAEKTVRYGVKSLVTRPLGIADHYVDNIHPMDFYYDRKDNVLDAIDYVTDAVDHVEDEVSGFVHEAADKVQQELNYLSGYLPNSISGTPDTTDTLGTNAKPGSAAPSVTKSLPPGAKGLSHVQSPCPPGYMLAPAHGQQGQSPCPPGYMLAPAHGQQGDHKCPPGYQYSPEPDAHGNCPYGFMPIARGRDSSGRPKMVCLPPVW